MFYANQNYLTNFDFDYVDFSGYFDFKSLYWDASPLKILFESIFVEDVEDAEVVPDSDKRNPQEKAEGSSEFCDQGG